MRSLHMLYGSGLWYAICLVSLGLVLATAVMLVSLVGEQRGRKLCLLSLANTIVAFLLFVILMDAGHAAVNHTGSYLPLQQSLFALPWLYFALPELAIMALLSVLALNQHCYQKTHLTHDVVLQALNLLPEGIAISDTNALVRLSNVRMDALSRELSAEPLTNADRFLTRLKEECIAHTEQLLVPLHDGSIWLFEEAPLVLDGIEYRQLIAHDVSECYRIVEELAEKNEQLLDIQERMKAVSELSATMFVAAEQARARAALHNQLGQVLLMGRHYLKHPQSADPKLVYLATQQMNRFLLGEIEQLVGTQSDSLVEARAMATSVGVQVELTGVVPQDPQIRELVAQAIIECATNTVKHAEGDALCVELVDGGKNLFVALSNNGRPPVSHISESGGLLSLRRRVEDAGGSMFIQSMPAFSLKLLIPHSANSRQHRGNGTNG